MVYWISIGTLKPITAISFALVLLLRNWLISVGLVATIYGLYLLVIGFCGCFVQDASYESSPKVAEEKRKSAVEVN